MILVEQTAIQQMVLVIRKPNVHYVMNKISPFDPNLRQLNPLLFLFQFCKIHFNIIILSALELVKRPPSFGVIILSLLSPFSFI